MIGSRRLVRIGLSARIPHPEQDARCIRSKTLQVLEQPVAQWAMARGMQLINVALDGSLFQDLPTQCQGAVALESGAYDRNAHAVALAEKGQQARWFGGAAGGRVVSLPRQAGEERLDCALIIEAFLAAARP